MSGGDLPEPMRHGPIKEIFPDVYFVKGSMKVGGPFAFSRNMSIVRQDGDLMLVNSVRLGDAGLAALERLGRIKHVIRLAGFHGMDDPFYKQRYGAKVWTVKGQPYVKGFGDKNATPYFHADVEMDERTVLPFKGLRLYRFKSVQPGEGLLRIDQHNGIVIAGDALQNWGTTDEYFSFAGKIMMRAMGFIKPHNLGPGWLKMAKPDPTELRGILELGFDHLLPAHGEPVIGGALEAYRGRIEQVARQRRG